MPLINLIKEQRLEARRKERQVRLTMLGSLGIGALCMVATAGLMLDSARLNVEASQLEQKAKELEPLVQELEANQTEIEALQPRIVSLEEATTFTAQWGRILDHMTTNVPQGAWLTSMKAFQQDRTKPLVVTFNGVSQSNDLVGDLILRIESCEELENVRLKFTQPKFSSTGKQLEFEVEADVVGTSEESEVPKEKKA